MLIANYLRPLPRIGVDVVTLGAMSPDRRDAAEALHTCPSGWLGYELRTFPRPRRDLPAWLAAARADGADGHHRLIHKVDTWFDRHLVSQWAGARDAPDAVYDRLSREFTGGGVDALVVASGALHPMGRPRTAHPRRRPVVAGVARDAAPEALRDASSRPSGAFADPRPDGVFWSLMRDAAGQLYVGVMGGRAPVPGGGRIYAVVAAD